MESIMSNIVLVNANVIELSQSLALSTMNNPVVVVNTASSLIARIDAIRKELDIVQEISSIEISANSNLTTVNLVCTATLKPVA
jgi:hypothetical protein